MLDPIRDDLKRERGDAGDGALTSFAVAKDAGKHGNLGDPPAVRFLLRFDAELHADDHCTRSPTRTMVVRLSAPPSGTIRPMPVYEFRCLACKAKFSALIGMTAEPDDESCPKCGSKDTQRLVSRFARARSEDALIDELADRVETMGEPESPAEMRRLVRDMGKAMDEDMADEMEEMYEADLSGAGEDDE